MATVKSRLTKGRLRMRQRLLRRGLAPGAVGAALALTGDAHSQPFPETHPRTIRVRRAGVLPVFIT